MGTSRTSAYPVVSGPKTRVLGRNSRRKVHEPREGVVYDRHQMGIGKPRKSGTRDSTQVPPGNSIFTRGIGTGLPKRTTGAVLTLLVALKRPQNTEKRRFWHPGKHPGQCRVNGTGLKARENEVRRDGCVNRPTANRPTNYRQGPSIVCWSVSVGRFVGRLRGAPTMTRCVNLVQEGTESWIIIRTQSSHSKHRHMSC